jgi:general secretion pathway protein D
MNMPPLKPLALSLLLLMAPSVWAEKTWKINLKDADISALVNEMAEITGKNFVVDPRVKGNVTVISSRAMSSSELYELFQSVLSINGFAAVPNGPVIKILPDTNARQSGVRVDAAGLGSGETLVTRVIMLQQANANELLAALRPMMPQFAHMASVPGANALIISDRANNADAMEAVIRELDSGQPDDAIEIIPLRNGKAEDLINILETMEAGGAAAGRDGKAPGKVRIVADERTNRLLVRGDKALRDRVRAMIRNLDEAPEQSDEVVKVFRLKYANARQVAEVLRGVLADEKDKSSTTTSAGASSASSGTTNLSSNGDSGSGRSQPGTTTITVGSSSLIADESQNALIVRASPRQIRQIETILVDLDSRRAQVLIQAAIVEVSGDNAAQLGVQWAYGSPTSGVGVINFNNAGASAVSLATAAATGNFAGAGIGQGALLGIGTSSKDSNGDRTFIGALVQALDSVADANLLSTPSIMTLVNQEAKIVVGQNVPFITGSTGTAGSGVTNPFTTIQRQDVGITLKVTPSLSEGGTVRLDVEQEVSSVVPSVDGIRSSDIITNKRSIKTSILADDGQTIVLGGLVQDDVKKSTSKVPFLGDLPGVGVLFRATSESRVKRNLLVFLQPTILRDAASAAALTQKQYASVRRVDLGLDKEGRLTRLPANIQEIYQGGLQRDARNAPVKAGPAPVAPAANAPKASASEAPAPLKAQTPAPQARNDESAPQVYAADNAAAIQAQPLSLVDVEAQALRSQPVPAAEPAPAPRRAVQPIPSQASYVPPSTNPDPSAKPFSAVSADPVAAAYAPYQPVQQIDARPAERVEPASKVREESDFRPQAKPFMDDQDPALQAEQTPPTSKKKSKKSEPKSAPSDRPGMRKITTASGGVYYVPENPTSTPESSAAQSQPAATTASGSEKSGMREIRTSSGAVYYVPDTAPAESSSAP